MPVMPDLTGRRVLVTGGLGFIGSNLALRCADLGARVTVYDCADPRSGGNIANLEGAPERLEAVTGDIRDFESVRAAAEGQDLVFNCAAYTSHPNSMKEPYVDLEVNCLGTLNLLEALRRFNPGARLVHIGTSTQVGRMLHSPVDESHPEFPVDIYSANKSASEKYVLVYASAHGLRATVIRLANNYGPRSNIRSPEFGFMNYFIGLALQGRVLPVFGEGSQLRTISYVEDSVADLIRVAEAEAAVGRVFFSASDRQYSVARIAREIVDVLGGEVRFVPWPREREDIEVGDAVISGAALRVVLGDAEPRHDLRHGLEKTREYFASRLRAYLP